MKKYILPLFVLCFALLCIPFAASADADYRYGDANGDGKLNTADITTIRRYISDGRTTDPAGYNVTIHPNAADVDGNGRINTMDITLIRRYIADNWKTDPNGYNVTLKPGKMDCTHSDMIATAEKQPTCSEEGNIAYWYCQPCDKYFADAAGKYEILLDNTVLPATGHDFDELWSADNDGHWHDALCEHVDEISGEADHTFVDHKCSVCGADETVTVLFQDYSGAVISRQRIVYGTDAAAPGEIPERAGYVFTGWDSTFTAVTADLTVKAQYDKVHTVTFVDMDGTVLEIENVVNGQAATAPDYTALPVPTGYKRIGWDKTFHKIEADTTVTLQYEKLTYTVTFKMPDGTTIADVVTEYGTDAEAPVPSEYFFDWSSYTMGSFSGWNGNLKNITKNTTVYAEYYGDYTQPVISIDTTASSASIKLYAPEGCYVYAIDFGFNWSGEIAIESCTKNSASSLYKSTNSSFNFDYNNKYDTFRYTWTNAEGVAVGGNYATIATITFETDGGASVNKDILQLLSDCMLVFSTQQKAGINNLQTVTPIIVVR